MSAGPRFRQQRAQGVASEYGAVLGIQRKESTSPHLDFIAFRAHSAYFVPGHDVAEEERDGF